MFDDLLGGSADFFKYMGFLIFVCFVIFLVCKTVSFNYNFVEGLVSARKDDEVAKILKAGGNGGRVGLDHDKIIKNLEDNRGLLNKLLQMPQDTGKLREQLDDFKENVVLEELLLLNEASCRDCSKDRLIKVGMELKAYSNIKKALEGVSLDKSSGWL